MDFLQENLEVKGTVMPEGDCIFHGTEYAAAGCGILTRHCPHNGAVCYTGAA
jgi:hypothetical protein